MRPQHIWTTEELARFLDATRDGRLEPAWHLAAGAGLRVGEMLALRWADVDLERARLRVRQALIGVPYDLLRAPQACGSTRTVGLDPKTAALLAQARFRQEVERTEWGNDYHDRDLVICREDGSPLHPRDLSRAFLRVVERAGVRPVPIGSVRRTGAALAEGQGLPA